MFLGEEKMDAIEKQIDEFRYEAVDGAKVRIVEDMAVNDDERVIPFLLEVLCDPDEFELARVEAAKLLGSGFEVQRERICEALAEVLDRTHASEAVFNPVMDAASAYDHHSTELRAALRRAEERALEADPQGVSRRETSTRDAELALGFLDELGGLEL